MSKYDWEDEHYQSANCSTLREVGTHRLLERRELLLGVELVQQNVEGAGENERREEAEPCEIGVALRAVGWSHARRSGWGERENDMAARSMKVNV